MRDCHVRLDVLSRLWVHELQLPAVSQWPAAHVSVNKPVDVMSRFFISVSSLTAFFSLLRLQSFSSFMTRFLSPMQSGWLISSDCTKMEREPQRMYSFDLQERVISAGLLPLNLHDMVILLKAWLRSESTASSHSKSPRCCKMSGDQPNLASDTERRGTWTEQTIDGHWNVYTTEC